jgi:hypothetical protein
VTRPAPCICTDVGEDPLCPIHGYEAVIRRLVDENERLTDQQQANCTEVIEAVAARLPGAVTVARASNLLYALDAAGYAVIRKPAFDEGDR